MHAGAIHHKKSAEPRVELLKYFVVCNMHRFTPFFILVTGAVYGSSAILEINSQNIKNSK